MEQKIYLIGDLHGDFHPVQNFCQRNPSLYKDQESTENVLIVLGDFGANYFFNHRDENFKKKLGKYPLTYFIIRGNHEERPSIVAEKHQENWHVEKFWNGYVWVENDYPYIKYAMDYVTFYEIPYKSYNKDVLKVLTIPGAYSIDKFYRLQKGFSWFEQEQLSERERNRGLSLLTASNWTCDLVLSHTCPIMFEPTDLFLSVVDQSMVDKTMERYLGGIEYNLDYRAWCWGHYHQYRNYPRTDGRRRLMLFNDYAVELTDFMESEVPTKL